MTTNTLSELSTKNIVLTPKEDKQGVTIKLKVFWKTTKFWTTADIEDFQKSVPNIAEQLRTERYWNKDGDIRTNRFTCEDFAIRILCEYAQRHGLPVKLTTGVRTYRNMEIYSTSAHEGYGSNLYGFCEMVMLSYGAPDMQRTGINTIAVSTPEELLPGDILAQSLDRAKNIAHHIQIVTSTSHSTIRIFQGNSSGAIVRPITTVMRWVGMNRADPNDSSYAGMQIGLGTYERVENGWNYKNDSTKKEHKNFLKVFLFYRWNFMGFNK